MTQYYVAFPPQATDDVLAEWLPKHGLNQCHIAETENYVHVTCFFNGDVEKRFANEIRDKIPSFKVATYDLDPKMSAHPVVDKLAERIGEATFEFLKNNFAPPDMVGYTGVYDAAVQAVGAINKAIGTIYEACKNHGYIRNAE